MTKTKTKIALVQKFVVFYCLNIPSLLTLYLTTRTVYFFIIFLTAEDLPKEKLQRQWCGVCAVVCYCVSSLTLEHTFTRFACVCVNVATVQIDNFQFAPFAFFYRCYNYFTIFFLSINCKLKVIKTYSNTYNNEKNNQIFMTFSKM